MPEPLDTLEQLESLPDDQGERVALLFLLGRFPQMPPPLLGWHLSRVVKTPNVCGGSARLIRTRIPIWVLERMRQVGFTEANILESYPTLTASDLVQAWGYVAVYSEEIQKEIRENEQD